MTICRKANSTDRMFWSAWIEAFDHLERRCRLLRRLHKGRDFRSNSAVRSVIRSLQDKRCEECCGLDLHIKAQESPQWIRKKSFESQAPTQTLCARSTMKYTTYCSQADGLSRHSEPSGLLQRSWSSRRHQGQTSSGEGRREIGSRRLYWRLQRPMEAS